MPGLGVNLIWKLNRLRAMSVPEVGFRAMRVAHSALERAGLRLARPAEPRGNAGAPWWPTLPTALDSAPYVAAAERTMAGRFDVFALRDAPLGFPPAWNRDPKTGVDAPMGFGKSIDYRQESLVGDIKYLWEPNRHLELVGLAQAWHLTRDPRYSMACRALVESWIDACPYPRGPNWTSSLEHGIRLVNWSFAWHLLGGESSQLFADEEGRRFRRRWLESIHQHCHFIAHFLSLHSSANNHLLGELAGLFVASCTWPLWPQSETWRERSHRFFEAEALRQTHEDGVNREQAFWYQASVMEMMIVAALVGKANAAPFGDAFHARLGSMAAFLESVTDVSGDVPAVGDADDGELLRLDPRRGRRYATLCAAASLLSGRAGRHDLPVDDSLRWLFGEAVEWLPARSGAPLLPRRSFPDGGYYVLGDEFGTSREVRIVADAGPLGYLGIAAHGHADCLSFTLSAGGVALLVDPGTYAYHVDAHWRDFFRGTSAHNTVRIDGVDQSVSGGAFMWVRHARATVESFAIERDADRLVAAHDGYRRLSDPVEHRRSFTYLRDQRKLLVDDELRCSARHRVELFWHFPSGGVVELSAGRARVVRGASCLWIEPPSQMQLRIDQEDTSRPQGWVSAGLDLRKPAPVLVCTVDIQGTVTLRSSIAVN